MAILYATDNEDLIGITTDNGPPPGSTLLPTTMPVAGLTRCIALSGIGWIVHSGERNTRTGPGLYWRMG